ncbi:hypothetical protein DFS33DRAFT_1310002 [Desarmillaria ectypa]|nr:hypothetical protein DFS33DRAFT_1310002 [Desarmillaria ectypa]
MNETKPGVKPCTNQADENLLIDMRVYFEKPQTTKGLFNDPELNGSKSLHIAQMLSIARSWVTCWMRVPGYSHAAVYD